MAWIMGPSTAKVGDNVTLTCHAPSKPPSSYKWIFNGSEVADTAVYVTPPFTEEMNRTYTCVAHNNITDKNSTAHKTINALCESQPSFSFFFFCFKKMLVLQMQQSGMFSLFRSNNGCPDRVPDESCHGRASL